MKRKIEFNAKNYAWQMSKYALFGGLGALALYYAFSSDTINFYTVFSVCAGAAIQYYSSLKKPINDLSTDENEIYLKGIPAAMRHQKTLYGQPYIRVTAVTTHGYHRIKVFEEYLAPSDWQLLSERCS